MKDPGLQKLIDDAKTRRFRDGEAKGLVQTIGDEIKNQLAPLFSQHSKETSDALKAAVKDLKVEVPKSEAAQVHVNVPDIHVPNFPQIPQPKVTVNVPKSERPHVTVQPTPVTFPSEMSLKAGSRPFPVIMMDSAGKPMLFPQGSGGATGGKSDFFTIVGMPASTATVMVDSSGIAYSGSNPVPTSGSVSLTLATGQGDGASAIRTIQAGDTVSSVIVNSGTITTVTTLTGITNSIQVVQLDRDGNPQTQPTIAQGDAATAQRVVIAGNSDASVVINSGTLTTVTTLTGITNSVGTVLLDSGGVAYSGTNPVPTTATISLPAGQGDAASATRVVIAGNSDASVVINSGTITTVTTLTGVTNSIAVVALDRDGNPLTTGPIAQGDVATALRVVLAGNSDASVVVNSGTITTVTTLTGVTNSIQVVQLDRDGNPWQPETFGTGDAATAMRVVIAGNSDASVVVNSGTITTVTTLTGITNTVATANIDSSGVQYSGTNPMPITTVGGGPDSMFVYQARTTLPTAVADGADVRPKADKLGRAITRPINARDLISTAYVTLSTGTEATLLAGIAGSFLDLISIIAVNTSTAAQQLDIRAVSAGNIVQSLYIPAQATTGWTPPVPWPQDATGNNWTVDMPDVTNSNIIISALFTKES